MPKVSVNILTKDRAKPLSQAIASVVKQSFRDFEIVVVNDGSTDETQNVIESYYHFNILSIHHPSSIGITRSRQEALEASKGQYIAILDDDDEWIDEDKLKKQVEFLYTHPDYVLVGGGIQIISNSEFLISKKIPNPKSQIIKHRPSSDAGIRNTMLFRNNFFTSTVMFRREEALGAGGFIKDKIDLAEDYDLWLRMGVLGKMYNFQEVFTQYSKPDYNKEKFRLFLEKQLILIGKHKPNYPHYYLANLILKARYALHI